MFRGGEVLGKGLESRKATAMLAERGWGTRSNQHEFAFFAVG